MTFSRNGASHRILTALCIEPLDMDGLKDACALPADLPHQVSRQRRKVWFAAHRLQSLGLIHRTADTYTITPEGLDELDRLGPIAVRVFATNQKETT